MAQAQAQGENRTQSSALAIKRDVVDTVTSKVRDFIENGELHLPERYSPENALKSAWLTLQSTKDKNGNLALNVCTKESIANSLLDMVVQGLNPAKEQCYFIAYGKQLICQRSYLGTMAVCKQVGATDIWAEVVYEGDEFEYEIKHNRKNIIKHAQKLDNVDPSKVKAAYCVIEFGDGRPAYTEIMTIGQIKQAWAQGQVYSEKGSGTHQKFAEEMAKKTVINRACKTHINSSDDSSLMIQHYNRSDEMRAEQEAAEEAEATANQEVIDVKGTPVDGDDEPEGGGNGEAPPETEQPKEEEPEEQEEQQQQRRRPPQSSRQSQRAQQQSFVEGPGF